MRARAALAIVSLFCLPLLSAPAAAVTCDNVGFEGLSYSICTVDAATEDLRLFHTDRTGKVHGSFDAVAAAHPDRTLAFAMNAGMYHPDRRPVGLYLENGSETMRLVPNAGPGNFGLLPNGVLCLTDTTAQVIETLRYAADPPDCTFASQSGPMLVIDGALHPRFLPDSTSRNIRNAVGTSADGRTAVFAISNQAVTFDEFGRFFRDGLDLPQALYLDGNISRLHAPPLGRSDGGFAMGPIVGVLE